MYNLVMCLAGKMQHDDRLFVCTLDSYYPTMGQCRSCHFLNRLFLCCRWAAFLVSRGAGRGCSLWGCGARLCLDCSRTRLRCWSGGNNRRLALAMQLDTRKESQLQAKLRRSLVLLHQIVLRENARTLGQFLQPKLPGYSHNVTGLV